MAYYFRKKYNRQDKTFPEIRIYELCSLPIRSIKAEDTESSRANTELCSLVGAMIRLHEDCSKAKSESEKEPITRQIAATDKKIDKLVYELYGLTEEEIRIVEGIKED
jgi:hypothetical protein